MIKCEGKTREKRKTSKENLSRGKEKENKYQDTAFGLLLSETIRPRHALLDPPKTAVHTGT